MAQIIPHHGQGHSTGEGMGGMGMAEPMGTGFREAVGCFGIALRAILRERGP